MDLREVPREPFRRHPWEIARARFFCDLAAGAVRTDGTVSVLDVGAGDGWLAAQLAARLPGARVTCWDTGYTDEALAALRREAGEQLHFTADAPDARFSLLLLLDVVEHVAHDEEFVAEQVRERLAPGGYAIVSVPAWPALRTSHDDHLGHCRRYRPADIAALLERAGLLVLRRGGVFHSLVVPRTIRRLREGLFGVPSGSAPPEVLEWRGGRLLGQAVGAALALDNAASLLAARAHVELPGLSWWGLCRRP